MGSPASPKEAVFPPSSTEYPGCGYNGTWPMPLPKITSFGPVARGCQWESQKHMQPFLRQGETALMKTMDRHYREGLSAVWPGLPPPVLTQLKKDGLGDGSKARWEGRTWA